MVESTGNLKINDFSQKLLKIGVENAIYTDMGGWSEGWFRAGGNKIIPLGNNKTQTRRQTNWIVFKMNSTGESIR